jgi:hypothetical protein
MRRKLGLGASLVGAPRLLLLDEPTTGLDPRSRIDLWDAIRELAHHGSALPPRHGLPTSWSNLLARLSIKAILGAPAPRHVRSSGSSRHVDQVAMDREGRRGERR